MKRLVCLAILALAACEPKPEEPALDGAPELDGGPSPAPGELPADVGVPAPGALLPGIINVVPPANMQVIDNCEAIVAADYDTPPKMACLLYMTDDANAGQRDAGFTSAMAAAGWTFIRAQGAELYFERLKPGGDCADLAAVSLVDEARTQKLVDHVAPKDGPPVILPTHHVWQAYSIPASTHQACGADRMKP
jgi:hypothetical protein